MMKIIQINETCGQGSTGRLVQELNDGLLQAGHDAFVFYGSGNSEYEYASKIGNRRSQIAHAILSRITGLQGYFSVSSTRQLLKTLDSIKPDIVHLHNLHGNYINLGILLDYTAKHKIPIAITLHDCWFFTGKCTHFIACGCYKWRSQCEKCPQLHTDQVNPTFFFDRTRKCFSDKRMWFTKQTRIGVIGVSEWISNEVKYSILKNALIETIPNWIDTNVFKYYKCKSEFNAVNGKKIVLMVMSVISESKGYYEMLYLAKNLPQDYQIVLVGGNKDNLVIPSNVLHIKSIKDKVKLAKLYSSADVCVNTTKHETFGLVTVEAMACGTPAIVYNNTASNEIIPLGCGYILEENKGYKALLDAVINACTSNNLRPREEISMIIHGKYGKQTSINKYIDFYENLVG